MDFHFPVEHDRIRYTGICVCRLPLIAENEMSQLVDAEIIEESCTKCGKLRKCVRDRITFGVDVDEVHAAVVFVFTTLLLLWQLSSTLLPLCCYWGRSNYYLNCASLILIIRFCRLCVKCDFE